MCVSRVAWEDPTHSWYLLNRILIVVIYMSIDFAVDKSGDSGRYGGYTAPSTGTPAVNSSQSLRCRAWLLLPNLPLQTWAGHCPSIHPLPHFKMWNQILGVFLDKGSVFSTRATSIYKTKGSCFFQCHPNNRWQSDVATSLLI